MRLLLSIVALCFVVASATAAYSQSCPPRHHWCGPGRGCCANGEKCAPVSGCVGGNANRTGVKCGPGRCLPGFYCMTDDDGVERCARR